MKNERQETPEEYFKRTSKKTYRYFKKIRLTGVLNSMARHYAVQYHEDTLKLTMTPEEYTMQRHKEFGIPFPFEDGTVKIKR